MNAAIVFNPRSKHVERDSYVHTIIVLSEKQFSDDSERNALEESFGKENNALFINSVPYNLQAGDLYNGIAWTRNIDGEQVVLTGEERSSEDVEELLRILEGGEIDGADN